MKLVNARPGPQPRDVCPKGHSMHDAYERPDGKGRECRICRTERNANRRRSR